MNKFLLLTAISFSLFLFIASINPVYAISKEEKKLSEFIKKYESEASKLELDVNNTEWNAYISGKKEDYDEMSKAEIAWNLYHSNKEAYKQLIEWRDSNNITSPDLKRKLSLIINNYGPYQFSAELIEKISQKEAELQRIFNSYRGKIDDKTVTEKDIYEILGKSKNTEERQKAWEAQKAVGPEVESKLIELIKLRNQGAKELGFSNFHEMSVSFSDQDPKEVEEIFKSLASDTDKKFIEYKKELDKKIASRVNKKVEELMPWDYSNPFFQDESEGFAPDLSKYYEGRNIPLIGYSFYNEIGLPLGNVLKNSDLYEKEGKSQHAFCFDIDRNNDARILMNIRPNEESLSTLLHESGHAVYDLNTDKSQSWLYRTQAHTLTTEGSAMYFERFTKNPKWLEKNMGIKLSKDEIKNLKKQETLSDLIFCRWTLVMYNFEKSMYENPDQDLNSLWWELVEKYQNIKKPEGRNKADWASKIHLVSAPVYYHNYMLAGLLVAQLQHKIGTKFAKDEKWDEFDVTGNKEVGRWLKTNIYKPGAKYNWNLLIKKATGEELTSKYFVERID